MSLAVTSSITWWFLRPLIAANMPRIMRASLLAHAICVIVDGSTPWVPLTVRTGLPSLDWLTLSTTPVWATLASSVHVTVRPIRPTEWSSERFVAIAALAVARLVTCSSVENDAIWPMKSWSCMGFMGSWCWSWATNSLRNWSLPSSALRPPAACVDGAGEPVPLMEERAMGSRGVGGGGLGEDVDEQAVGQ